MESDSGLLRWLKVPFLYNLFQEAVGAKAVRRRLIQNHVRANVGDKVIDIGCGMAQILQGLPEVEYLGLDTNSLILRLLGGDTAAMVRLWLATHSRFEAIRDVEMPIS
jgi:hypothetical protein